MVRKSPEDPQRRQRRRRLKKQTPRLDLMCAVPGCGPGVVGEDESGECCYRHSVEPAAGGHAGVWSLNDGIVDTVAIDITREGLRRVPLTWVEWEIAVAHMIKDGLNYEEIRERTGVNSAFSSARMKPIREIADAL